MSADACPCGSGQPYTACCQPYHAGQQLAPSAQTLMRARYCAYVLGKVNFLLATWHPRTRPPRLDLDQPPTKWLGLTVKHHAQQDAEHATVEFVARYKLQDRGHRLHEVSRFVREAGQWFYVDGLID